MIISWSATLRLSLPCSPQEASITEAKSQPMSLPEMSLRENKRASPDLESMMGRKNRLQIHRSSKEKMLLSPLLQRFPSTRSALAAETVSKKMRKVERRMRVRSAPPNAFVQGQLESSSSYPPSPSSRRQVYMVLATILEQTLYVACVACPYQADHLASWIRYNMVTIHPLPTLQLIDILQSKRS